MPECFRCRTICLRDTTTSFVAHIAELRHGVRAYVLEAALDCLVLELLHGPLASNPATCQCAGTQSSLWNPPLPGFCLLLVIPEKAG